MLTFLATYWLELIFGLIAAGALALCKYFHKKVKEIKKLYENEEAEALEHRIEVKLEPIYQELEELRDVVRKDRELEQSHVKIILSSYKYRLTVICKELIRQGYMTPEQYEQLTEFYRVYHDLGGNGQAKDFYEKAMKLQVHDE